MNVTKVNSIEVSLILWEYYDSKSEDGTYPVKVKVYQNRKRNYKKTDVRVRPDQWDAEKEEVYNHPQAKILNAKLRKFKSTYDDSALKAQVLNKTLNIRSVNKSGTFSSLAKEVRKDADEYLSRVKIICGRIPDFHEIDNAFMRRFEKKQRDMKYAPNTIALDSAFFRSVMNQAKKDGIVSSTPWDEDGGKYRSPKFVQSETVFLTFEERQVLYDRFLKERDEYVRSGQPFEKKYIVLVFLLMACYTGFRNSDWYNFDIDTRVQSDGFIRLRAQKNRQWVVIEIGERLNVLLEEIRKIGKYEVGYNLSIYHIHKIFKECKINKDGGTHIGRHSFGYACATLGISIEACATYLGITVETAAVYYHLVGATLKESSKALAAL